MYFLILSHSSQTTRVDDRDRRDRVEAQTGYWDIQMTRLVRAYLKFRAQSDDEGRATTSMPNEGDLSPPFTVKVLDMFRG